MKIAKSVKIHIANPATDGFGLRSYCELEAADCGLLANRKFLDIYSGPTEEFCERCLYLCGRDRYADDCAAATHWIADGLALANPDREPEGASG